jgi:hypothetical protein
MTSSFCRYRQQTFTHGTFDAHFLLNKVLHSASGKVMRDLESLRTISRHVDEQRLVRFRSHMEMGAAVFAAKNPDVELLAYQGTAAQQRAARVAAQAGTKKHPPVPLTPAAKASD